MRTAIVFLLCIVALCFLPIMSSSAQDKFPKPAFRSSLPGQTLSNRALQYKIAGKRASQYTAQDWGQVIDSTWGPGQTAAEQLNVFDTFWDHVDQWWSGFPNISLNWDSMRTVYRPQIGSGLSRGRFAALMDRMWLSLLEHHTYIVDEGVYSTFAYPPQEFTYKKGVPLLVMGNGFLDVLGAAVTPMPDSSNLVYRVVPGNPLGLEPGDLILGYEGVPWKTLYRQMLDNGVPIFAFASSGSTPESRYHQLISGVGWNWGMFDTIDVVKYSTGDTLHLPTAPLSTIKSILWATEQVPVAGVPMPKGTYFWGGSEVSWGVVQGTNIGYVYVWDWDYGGPGVSAQLFRDAIYDLRHNKNVDGLVLDFRMNFGGWYSSANGGFSQLFNFDPTSNMARVWRAGSTNHMDFGSPENVSQAEFAPGSDLFDHPIAVLIGPACLSMGDWNAFRIRFHPMARSFGKPTNGAFVGGGYATGTVSGSWSYQIPYDAVYSRVPGEGYLVHKGVQPDELVWLTRDGVAKGEDDVVKRALAWMTTLTYAHGVALDRTLFRPGFDSISITATLANPLHHVAALSAIVVDTNGTVQDSVVLVNDGLHGDGGAGDSVWGAYVRAPLQTDTYGVTLRTDDITAGTFRRLPNVVRFTTENILWVYAGDANNDGVVDARDILPIGRFFGKTGDARAGGSHTWSRQNVLATWSPAEAAYADCDGNGTVDANDVLGIINNWGNTTSGPASSRNPLAVCEELLKAIDAQGTPSGAMLEIRNAIVRYMISRLGMPLAFALEQNWPNPFNPTTVISYQLPVVSQVSLRVFDLLGREVAVLVNETKAPGEYTVTFDASRLSTGIYIFRMIAGPFRSAKRMALIK